MGRKNVLMLGCVCQSLAMLSFTLLINLENTMLFGILSFVVRFSEGFGNGCINSSCSSIICFNYEENMSKYIGFVQTATGIGMLTGPLIGSMLYEAGGFKLPFLLTGGSLLMMTLLIKYLVPSDQDIDVISETTSTEVDEEDKY